MRVNASLSLILSALFAICLPTAGVAQQSGRSEQPVPLSEAAIALDASGASALEGRLRTTTLNGAPDMPVTNIRLMIKNISPVAYAYVSGLVTVYDPNDVRCGEGTFKADVLAVNESFETDAPGIRIQCAPSTWRIVATNLVPRTPPDSSTAGAQTMGAVNLLISVDGEEHPIQLGKPMVLTLGDRKRTLILRQAP